MRAKWILVAMISVVPAAFAGTLADELDSLGKPPPAPKAKSPSKSERPSRNDDARAHHVAPRMQIAVARCNETDVDDCLRECTNGDFGSCSAAAKMLAPTDGMRSFALYRTACEGGDAFGCFALALIYHGDTVPGVQKDLSRALPLAGKACSVDVPQSCLILGLMIVEKSGMDGLPKANVVFQQLCARGDPDGCKVLGFATAGEAGDRTSCKEIGL
jgi:TPR repeat protein